MRDTNLHIVQTLAVGGLETLALDLVRDLPGDNRIVSLEGEAAALIRAWPRLQAFRDHLFAIGKRRGVDLGALARVIGLIRRQPPRAVITHHIGPLIYGGVAARLMGVRTIIHVEHDAWHYRSARRRIVAQIAMAFVRPTIVAVTPGVAETVRRLFPTRRVNIVANGVDLTRSRASRESARAALDLPADRRVVGVAARLEAVKGVDLLIDAFARLPDDVILVIAGGGSEEAALRRQVDRLRLGARVRFVGRRDDMLDIYPAFDVFCLPSRAEGLPLVVLEAQAAGVPTVATDVGDIASALCPVASRIVPPEDPTALAKALRDVLDGDRDLSPRQFIQRRFCWRDTLEGYVSLIGANQ